MRASILAFYYTTRRLSRHSFYKWIPELVKEKCKKLRENIILPINNKFLFLSFFQRFTDAWGEGKGLAKQTIHFILLAAFVLWPSSSSFARHVAQNESQHFFSVLLFYRLFVAVVVESQFGLEFLAARHVSDKERSQLRPVNKWNSTQTVWSSLIEHFITMSLALGSRAHRNAPLELIQHKTKYENDV